MASLQDFNINKAHLLAKVSRLAYTNDLQFQGFDVQFFDNGGTQAYTISNKSQTIVVFRGTEMVLQDWLTDLDFNLTSCSIGRVHRGFSEALDNIWPLEIPQNKPVWVAGHSLGAALAAIATSRWRGSGYRVDGLYTFGQPRTFDEVAAKNFNADFKNQTFRFVNNNDIITRIPPRILGYSHIGTLKYFTEDGKLMSNIGWWYRFLDRIQGRIEDIFEWGTDGIKDHNMSNYETLIKKEKQ